MAQLKKSYESSFIEINCNEQGGITQKIPRPYELFIKSKDNRREIIDITANKKFNKQYTMDDIARIEIVFPQNTDIK